MKKTFTLLVITIFTATLIATKSSAQITDLNQIKALYTTANVKLPSAILKGVVISDTINKNVSAGVAVVEAQGTGIELYFGKAIGHVYNVGDSINLDVTGDSLKAYDGALEIVPNGTTFPAPIAHNVYVNPTPIDIYDLTNNIEQYAYQLVIIHHAAINTTSNTFSGSNNLADNTGSMVIYTATAATFASDAPTTDTMDFIGYLNPYEAKGSTTPTPEFAIRSLNDIVWPLPVALINFVATAKGLTSLLNWNTANEVNISKFVIEKSLDGVTFNSLASIAAKGQASNSYNYIDADIKAGTTVYYRLQLVAKDGSSTYGSVQRVVFASSNKLSTYPNPASTTTKLTYAANAHDVVARILSIDGKVVKQVVLAAGTTATDIEVGGLAKGVYYVEAEINGKEIVSFVKD
jgi:hypothetical protein